VGSALLLSAVAEVASAVMAVVNSSALVVVVDVADVMAAAEVGFAAAGFAAAGPATSCNAAGAVMSSAAADPALVVYGVQTATEAGVGSGVTAVLQTISGCDLLPCCLKPLVGCVRRSIQVCRIISYNSKLMSMCRYQVTGLRLVLCTGVTL